MKKMYLATDHSDEDSGFVATSKSLRGVVKKTDHRISYYSQYRSFTKRRITLAEHLLLVKTYEIDFERETIREISREDVLQLTKGCGDDDDDDDGYVDDDA